MSKLRDIEYVDGQIMVYIDGEVLECNHLGGNRMGREWSFNTIRPTGSVLANILFESEYTHISGDNQYKAIILKDREAFDTWSAPLIRGKLRTMLISEGYEPELKEM